jgi:hypothetical protein
VMSSLVATHLMDTGDAHKLASSPSEVPPSSAAIFNRKRAICVSRQITPEASVGSVNDRISEIVSSARTAIFIRLETM